MYERAIQVVLGLGDGAGVGDIISKNVQPVFFFAGSRSEKHTPIKVRRWHHFPILFARLTIEKRLW